MTSIADPGLCPSDFMPLFRTSPFLDATGPYFYKPLVSGFVIGLRVLNRHTNASGTVHGGLIATLADVSMGYVTAMSKTPALRMITTSLGVDFTGTARVNDWVESEVSVVKTGSRMAFANAQITTCGAPVAHARAVFLVL